MPLEDGSERTSGADVGESGKTIASLGDGRGSIVEVVDKGLTDIKTITFFKLNLIIIELIFNINIIKNYFNNIYNYIFLIEIKKDTGAKRTTRLFKALSK